MKTSNIKVGLIGLGCVGQGVYQLLEGLSDKRFSITAIAVKDALKPRSVPVHLISNRWQSVVNDPENKVIIEAIDDAHEAWAIAQATLKLGKTLITANKKMVATNLEILEQLAKEYNGSVRYEAAVGGAIPILGLLDNQFEKETIRSVRGIVNGTTNYILTKVFQEKWEYAWALKQAQEAGFAESDPTNDVQGFDAMYKSILLANQAYGVVFQPHEVFHYGIHNLTSDDIRFARNQGLKIKLMQQAIALDERVATWVMPQFVASDDVFAGVSNELNAIEIEATYSGTHWIQGRGAGAFPTAFAILQDLQHIHTHGSYRQLKRALHFGKLSPSDLQLEVYVRYSNPEMKNLLGLEFIREALLDGDFSYVIGETTLEKLIQLKPALIEDQASLILTGRLPARIRTTTTKLKELKFSITSDQ